MNIEWNVAFGAVVIGVLFLTLYYGIVVYSMQRYGLIRNYKNLENKEKIGIIILLCGITIYFFLLILRDDTIVFWDRGFYWIKCLNFSDVLFSNPIGALKQIYESIDLTDYSDVVPAIMSVPFLLLGKHSYDLYRLQLFLMFQIPVYIIMTDIVNRILERLNIRNFKKSYLLTMFFCIAVSFLYIPTVYGLFDIADLVIACIIALVLLEFDYCRFDFKDDLLLSILFLVLLFIRRHFSFFALGYFACFILVQVIKIIKSKDKELFGGFIKNSCVVGGICIIVLIVFFRNYLIRTLGNNYAVQYSARSYGTMWDKYVTTFEWMGMLIIGLCGIGLITLVVKKRYDLAFIETASTVFIMYLYFRIQNLSAQHYYNFALQILILMCIGLYSLVAISKKKASGVICGGEIIVMCALFAHGMIPEVSLSNSLHLFSSVNYQPEVREDRTTIGDILDAAQMLVEKEGQSVYCTASSGVMNDDILKNYKLPTVRNAFPQLYTTCNTDLADGFPIGFLLSDIVIATDPAQIHANEDGQRIVWVLNDLMISDNSIFSDNFEAIDTYTIKDGVNVIIYRKVKAFSDEDYEYLIDTFDKWYADYPELFRDRIGEVKNMQMN